MSPFVRAVALGAMMAGLSVGLGSLAGCSGTSSSDKMMEGDKMKDEKMKMDDKMKMDEKMTR